VLPMLDPGHDLPLASGVAPQLVGDEHTRCSTLPLDAFLDRPLAGEWPYLWFDATYLKQRESVGSSKALP
jgi:hypothetical protein